MRVGITPDEDLLFPSAEAGRHLEEGFRDFAESIVQHVDEVFFWRDPDDPKPYFVSHAYERIWGRPCASAYAEPSSWIEAIHPEDRERVLNEFMGSSSAQTEYRIIRPDGDMRWIWARMFPARTVSGEVKRVVGIAQDCTERKQAEKTRAFLASIVESSDDSIIGTDLGGRILSWNQGAERLFGYTAAEALGKHITLLFAPDRQTDYLRTLGKVRRHEKVERSEGVRFGKDQVPIDVSIILSPIRDGSGQLQGVSAIYRDISDRKRVEREREAMEVQLRHAQKLESIGQLAAGIAHEINTPMQYIGDNTRYLKDAFQDLSAILRSTLDEAARSGSAGDLLTEIPSAIDQTLDGVDRVTTLVRAMKEFSHPGRKEKSPTDLNSAIANTIIVARNEWKYVAEMGTDFDPSLPLVPCMPGDFNQVILNLIVNAAHAIADAAQGKSLGKITVRTRLCQPWVEVQIQDTGSGIPEEVRNRIFDPFFTTKEVGRGTGQGLTLARSIVVDKHGGSITFDTQLGKGTTFIIRLPLDGGRAGSKG